MTMLNPDILLISAATGGGVRRTQELLANGMVAAGRSVAVANPKAGAPFFDRLDDTVEFVKLSGKSSPLGYLKSILGTVKSLRPKVVVASQDQTIVPLAVLRSLRMISVPLIGCIHNNPVVHKFARNPLSRTLPAMTRRAYRRMDQIIAVSHTLAGHIEATDCRVSRSGQNCASMAA